MIADALGALPSAALPPMLRACETHPDVILFARIGDLYDECGGEKMAYAWHWMARKGKWPKRVCLKTKSSGIDMLWMGGLDHQWSWYAEAQPLWKGCNVWTGVGSQCRVRKVHRLPGFFSLQPGNAVGIAHSEDTFLAAVVWLADRLDEVRAAL